MPRARKAVQAAAAHFGVEIRRANNSLDQHQQRAILLGRLGVTLVLDAGANIGQYAGTDLRRWTGYAGRIASFEPVAACYEACELASRDDPLWDVYHYGLSDVSSTATITVPQRATGLSSLQPATAAGLKLLAGCPVRTEEVDVRRLDDVIDSVVQGDDDVLALKIDVQGHEAAVLRGARSTIARVALVECELPLVTLYEDQATFEEMLRAFCDCGFVPVGVASNWVDRSTGFAMDADVFFVQHSLADDPAARVAS